MIFTTVCVSQKEQFHVDEIWSYSLSNSTKNPFFYWTCKGVGPPGAPSREKGFRITGSADFFDYFDHWHDSDFYNDYITVQSNERFNYSNVYYNQVCDVHPPLYYFILHTVCSLTPDCFSKWQGLIPNLIFYAVIMVYLYLIAEKLTKSKKTALLTMVFWGLSGGTVSAVSFIRMYLLLTMLAVMMMYYFICFMKELKTRYAVLISVIAFLGFLTQYVFYVYVFFITLLACLYFLLKKQFVNMFGLGFSILSSVAAALAVFPAVILHTFNGAFNAYAKFDFHNIFLLSYLLKLIRCIFNCFFYKLPEDVIFLVCVLIFLFLIIACLILSVKILMNIKGFLNKIQNSNIKTYIRNYYLNIIILVSVLITGYFLGRMTPYAASCFERYYFFLMPFFALYICRCIIFAVNIISSRFKINIKKVKVPVCISVCVMMLFVSNSFTPKEYIQGKQEIDLEKAINNKPCFCITENHMSHAFAPLFQYSAKVYPINYAYGSSNFKLMTEEMNNINGEYLLISCLDIDKIRSNSDFPENVEIQDLGRMGYTVENYNFYVYKMRTVSSKG